MHINYVCIYIIKLRLDIFQLKSFPAAKIIRNVVVCQNYATKACCSDPFTATKLLDYITFSYKFIRRNLSF